MQPEHQVRWCRSDALDDMCFSKSEAWRLPYQITTQSYMVCALVGSSAALFILFIFGIASANFFLVKIFGRTKYFLYGLWIFNLSFLVCNRIYEGYRFSSFGEHWAYLDDFRGTFRWHICFNFVVLRMISFGHDYHWTDQYSGSDHKKHIQRCDHCSTGKTCYLVLQERRVTNDKLLSC
ncbi:uncharacterized protein LOC131003987 isoform X1 [Salvia miltiorrhiza]|uniref:uncharacterized protein LOC131003987 isoform X1 n=1 Tax=Salvia miltiorrhiza TaxID=226208 RepID=UPI0025AD2FB6|nr:uncharacterized protein LOC131003987 isoform X1 [Salvia miltiorrhiza]